MSLDEIAREHATHKKDCSCEGRTFEPVMFDSFKVGYLKAMESKGVQGLVATLKICEIVLLGGMGPFSDQAAGTLATEALADFEANK